MGRRRDRQGRSRGAQGRHGQGEGLGAKHTDAPLGIGGTNPKYAEGRQWRSNCQRCVPAYEARCRGYDVTAKSSDGDRDGSGLNLARNSRAMWENQDATFFRARGFKSGVESVMAGFGDGARAEIRIGWKGKESGHVFIAVQENGTTRFYDPQNPSADASAYFSRAASRGGNAKHWLLRIDNNKFTDEAKRCFSSRA